MIKEAIRKVINKESLTCWEASECMRNMLEGKLTHAQIGALLVGLASKGEKKEEMLGMLQALREKMVHVDIEEDVVDTCGTGGDMIGSFNTSTAAALIASAAGAKVAKCGNRSASSLCGSADLLEEAGMKIELSPEEVKNWIDESGFAFLFSPKYHPALRELAPLRRELGTRTILNLIGPLGNPVCPKRHLLGVSKRELAPLYAEILLELGAKHSMVVHGLDGMDEISMSAPTEIYEIRDGKIFFLNLKPESFGFSYVSHQDIRGGDSKRNNNILLDLFNGKKGPIRQITCVNAAATLMLAGLAEDLREGLLLAERTIDSGAAREKFDELVKRSNQGGVNTHVYAR